MKKKLHLFTLTSALLLIALQTKAQSTSAAPALMEMDEAANMQLEDMRNYKKGSYTKHEYESSKIINISNKELVSELLNNNSKRAEITALPGVHKLSIYKTTNSLDIWIENNYIEKYLKELFDITASELTK